MNKYILIAAACILQWSGAQIFAQDIKSYDTKFNKGKVEIVDIGDLRIVESKINTVTIESEVEQDEKSDRAKGLRALNSAGLSDNTGMGISATVENGVLKITQISNDCFCEDVTIYVPNNVSIVFQGNNMSGGELLIEKVSNEINVSALHHNLILKDVTGPMAVKTVHGNIDGTFSNVNQDGSISIHAVYGHVDIGVPSSTKAELQLRAPYGEIYSDMDIQFDQDGEMRTISGKKINGSINGGGVPMMLKATYDNVYLRKSK